MLINPQIVLQYAVTISLLPMKSNVTTEIFNQTMAATLTVEWKEGTNVQKERIALLFVETELSLILKLVKTETRSKEMAALNVN